MFPALNWRVMVPLYQLERLNNITMKFTRKFYTLCICLIASYNSDAQIKLPQLIRDSMILQRDKKINIWGCASKEEKVSIKFNGKTYKTKTANDGKWKVQLSPARAGGPYSMQISGKNKITLHDILIGDVWLCAGQSNMEHQMNLHAVNYAAEIASADFSAIRQFEVPNVTNLVSPQNDVQSGSWKWADSSNVRDF